MKTLRQLCATVVVMLVFALSAYAEDGQVPCPGIASPPPPALTTMADGQVPCPGIAQSLLITLETVFLLS